MTNIMYFVAGGILRKDVAEMILTSTYNQLKLMRLDCPIAKELARQRMVILTKLENKTATVAKKKDKKEVEEKVEKDVTTRTTEEFWDQMEERDEETLDDWDDKMIENL